MPIMTSASRTAHAPVAHPCVSIAIATNVTIVQAAVISLFRETHSLTHVSTQRNVGNQPLCNIYCSPLYMHGIF